MQKINVVQGSQEWHQARCGMVTASEFKSVLAGGKGITRRKYMYQLIAERLSGEPIVNGYMTAAMERGIEIEDEARANYELTTTYDVHQVGFVKQSEHVGGSPDGLVDKGGVEIKCPDTHTHIGYLLERKLPSEYRAQIQGLIWICKREWWDFVSYDPRVKGHEMLILRVNRDEKYIAELETAISYFVGEMLEMERRLRGNGS